MLGLSALRLLRGMARQREVNAGRTLELDHFVLLRYCDEFRAKFYTQLCTHDETRKRVDGLKRKHALLGPDLQETVGL